MTPAEQLDAMATRIVAEALAQARAHYERELLAGHLREVCDEASEARKWALLRWRFRRA